MNFLALSQAPPGVVQERRHQDPGDRADHEERGHGLGADAEGLEEEADGDRRADGDEARRDHLLQGARA